MQGDDLDAIAMFLIQLAHSADKPDSRLTAIDYSDPHEHVKASVAELVTSCATGQRIGTLELCQKSNDGIPAVLSGPRCAVPGAKMS
jgi:hypothetical protein